MAKTIIDSTRKSYFVNFHELWAYRDLFVVLAWRDLRVRYAQTFLGLVWAGLQPLATLLIFTLIFGRALKVDTGDIPYPVFALAGMVAWSYFGYVLQQSGNSIVGAQEMVKKVYFPRLIIPLSKAVTGFVDFAVTLFFLFAVMIWYGVEFSVEIFFLPLYFLLLVIAALGVGIWVSALTIRYRDFQHVIPFIVQFGVYATPIAYPASLIPDKYQLIYHLNPMVGIVEGFRWALVGGPSLQGYGLLSLMLMVILFLLGLAYFSRVERNMADIV